MNAAKVRKDLSYLGSYGTRGVGYDVEYLLFQMSRELGLTHDWPVVIVGLGNLGHALANYGGFARAGLPGGRPGRRRPREVGTEIDGITVRHIDELPESPPSTRGHRHHRHAGRAAQDVADRLVAAGVTSILNFAPTVISVPDGGVAAQGRPRRRAADPELLPAAPRCRRGGPAVGPPGRRPRPPGAG